MSEATFKLAFELYKNCIESGQQAGIYALSISSNATDQRQQALSLLQNLGVVGHCIPATSCDGSIRVNVALVNDDWKPAAAVTAQEVVQKLASTLQIDEAIASEFVADHSDHLPLAERTIDSLTVALCMAYSSRG